jgi:hypothetical protein
VLIQPSLSTVVEAAGEDLYEVHCKKGYPFFPSPAGMSLTKLSLDKNNLIIPGQGEFG